MPALTLTSAGLAVDGKPLVLPCTKARLVAAFGRPGPEERNLYGVRWPFPAAAVVALENLQAEDKTNPIAQLTIRPEAAPGFTVEGQPWDKVRFRKTPYGPEKRFGGWVISQDDDGWTLYPEPDAAPVAPSKAGRRTRTAEPRAAPAKPAAGGKRAAATRPRTVKPLELAYPKVPRKDVLQFTDMNFKLAVIEHLMFDAKVLKPAFRLEGFVAAWKPRRIDLAIEGYDAPIAEVRAWFAAYPVDRKHVQKIRTLTQHPGAVIHGIYPQWTGEDDTFAIAAADDAKHLPALRQLSLFSRGKRRDAALARAFAARGVAATF